MSEVNGYVLLGAHAALEPMQSGSKMTGIITIGVKLYLNSGCLLGEWCRDQNFSNSKKFRLRF
ncbi:MAG: hypothetical protein ACI9WC_001214 [Arenicella sp.]|jgi:hypothetical protein